MIITGYQGIGKSTLASRRADIIDLESSSFWKVEGDTKSRPDDWYVFYCQVAQHLSSQGYTVFVSCHREVRDFLSVHNEERFCAIFPHKSLKDDWLRKLLTRYETTKSEKDLRAYEHAIGSFDQDIWRLWYECQYNVEYYRDARIIKDINYDLESLVNEMQEVEKILKGE